ncbi:hypothetical protein ACFLZ2_03870 [Candidatus Margulisiibacteriota bacterium]
MIRFFGWVIVILNAAAVLFSAVNLLNAIEMNFLGLLVAHASILGVALLTLGFIINNTLLMVISIPFMVAFGTFGLFTSSWASGVPYEQAGNLFMTMAIMYIIYVTIKKKAYVEFVTGIAIGMFLLLPFNKFQIDYLKGDPDLVKKLGDPKFEKAILGESPTLEADSIQKTEETIEKTTKDIKELVTPESIPGK